MKRDPDAILLQHPEPELRAYYADRKLMFRNIAFIGLANLGWQLAMQITAPLMVLRLLDAGVTEGWQATVGSVNLFLLSFLVMYFSWRSDHTVCKIGRRKPFFFLAAGPIIMATACFPAFHTAAPLVGLWMMKIFFMNLKATTFPLLKIDCVVRSMLARAQSIIALSAGIMGFGAMRLAPVLLDLGEWVPFAVGACVLTVSTSMAWWIKEPAIYHPRTEMFKPWSAIQTGLKDRRLIWLMLGVAMVGSFEASIHSWVWIWGKTVLGLERKEIFESLSWVFLLNIGLAFPIGLLIDKVGGFRVVLLYYVLMLFNCGLAIWVHDRASFTVLMVIMTFSNPLNISADMMLFKRADPKDVGSVTSTSSFFKNLYNGTFLFLCGTLIEWSSRNYHLVFGFGAIMMSVGIAMFLVFFRVMRTSEAQPEMPGQVEPPAG